MEKELGECWCLKIESCGDDGWKGNRLGDVIVGF